MTRTLTFTLTVVLGVAALDAAADWPQWQGPDRTRISKETGLLKEWPVAGPRLVWTANGLGTGYGSMSVAGDRVFLQGARGPNSFVIALNRADGKEVWSKALGPVETRMRTERGAGPRGTPTVDGDFDSADRDVRDLVAIGLFEGRDPAWLKRAKPFVGRRAAAWLRANHDCWRDCSAANDQIVPKILDGYHVRTVIARELQLPEDQVPGKTDATGLLPDTPLQPRRGG